MSSSDAAAPRAPISETRAIALVGAVQFVNVLDFMMVMPLGPDFAARLDIPVERIGLIGGSYTLAAGVAGLVGSVFLDRADRKRGLVLALLGLMLGTLAGGLSVDFTTLLASRVIAGAFGGPATALSIAVLADLVPPERRGGAMGKVMGAFSVASVLGLPFGLELARQFGFRAPFFFVAALTLVAATAAQRVMPPLRAHLDAPRGNDLGASLLEPTIALSLAASACIMAGNFAVIPNFSAYLQYNLGLPREQLGLLYMLGGAASFVTMRIVGHLVDRYGSAPMIVLGTVLYLLVLAGIFVVPVLAAVPLLAFPAFMTANSARFVPVQSLGSRVPTHEKRARFLSTQSAVQHFASSIGSMSSTAFLVAEPSGRLVGLERVALVTMALAAVVPFFSIAVERRVRAREASEAARA